jgi:hypothetical protein
MATSNNTIFQLSRDDIINAALRKLSVVGEGQVANAQQLIDSAQALNGVVAELQTLGLPLWKRVEYELVLVNGVSAYTIGIGQTLNQAFPLKLIQAETELTGASSRIDVEIKARNDFNSLPNSSTGTPVAISYQPYINYGVVSVWPTPNASVPTGSKIVLTYQKPFDYFDSGTNTADFPQEWGNALIYHLALVLADEYSLPLEDRRWIEKQADRRLSSALAFASEETSIFLYPNREG